MKIWLYSSFIKGIKSGVFLYSVPFDNLCLWIIKIINLSFNFGFSFSKTEIIWPIEFIKNKSFSVNLIINNLYFSSSINSWNFWIKASFDLNESLIKFNIDWELKLPNLFSIGLSSSKIISVDLLKVYIILFFEGNFLKYALKLSYLQCL